jgi:hypothetical protein
LRRTQLLLATATVLAGMLAAGGQGPAIGASWATASPVARSGPEVTVAPVAVVSATEARAARAVRVPGSLTGLGFDVCDTQDQATMDELRTESPYWGVGVYVGGENRYCSEQPELTRSWVHTQHHKGWRIFPIWNGLQAPTLRPGTRDEKRCATGRAFDTMSSSNSHAKRQGVSAANRAVNKAVGLGMAKGSTLFLDIEAYDNTTSACNQPVMNFQSGWSNRLHRLGWKSGVYSSAGSGIRALDYVRAAFPGTYVMPNAIWFAVGNGKPTLNGKPYLRDNFWPTQRIHQYDLDVSKTFGDVHFDQIDQNVISIGRGSVPGRVQHTCGVDLDFTHYRNWRRGDRSNQVKAAQCLLKRHGLFKPRISGRFDKATARGVGTYQDRRGLRVTRRMNASTWTSLLSGGTTPLVKRGSANDRVRFLQRSLVAASGERLTIDGVFRSSTTTAVKHYQRSVGLTVNGVVDKGTWKTLQRGHH